MKQNGGTRNIMFLEEDIQEFKIMLMTVIIYTSKTVNGSLQETG